MHKMEDGKIMLFNKINGEVEYKEIKGEFYDATYELSHYFPGTLDIRNN